MSKITDTVAELAAKVGELNQKWDANVEKPLAEAIGSVSGEAARMHQQRLEEDKRQGNYGAALGEALKEEVAIARHIGAKLGLSSEEAVPPNTAPATPQGPNTEREISRRG